MLSFDFPRFSKIIKLSEVPHDHQQLINHRYKLVEEMYHVRPEMSLILKVNR